MIPSKKKSQTEVVTKNFKLPHNWISKTLYNQKKLIGRTKYFPCFGSIAYFSRKIQSISDPTDHSSSLLELLKENISECIVATPIEPDSSEITDIGKYIIKNKIKAVCFGTLHPSKKENGKVFNYLKSQNIPVYNLELDQYISELDRRYWVWASKGRSYVHLKISLSADGMVIPVPGETTRLAGKESSKRIHRLRGIYDGLLIGGNTVRKDNPKMTYRGSEDLPQPTKIILSHNPIFDPELTSFKNTPPLIFSENNLATLCTQLAQKNITSILVEGGLKVYNEFIKQQMVDEITLIWTPKIWSVKGLRLTERLPFGKIKHVDEDIWEIIKWPAINSGRISPQRDIYEVYK